MAAEFPTNLDLDEVVKEWAWEDFQEVAKGDKKKRDLLKKHKKDPFIDVQIDWSKVNFVSTQDKWSRMPGPQGKANLSNLVDGADETLAKEEGGEGAQAAPLAADVWLATGEDEGLLPNKGRPDVNVLFQTKFINNGPGTNEYNLKVEKTTMSTCETTVESSFTKGMSFDLSLKTPCEVLEANAGFTRELTLTNTETETKEKSATWAVESKIEVPSNKVAEAFLVVEEETYSGKFEVKTLIWGNVHVRFFNLRKPGEKQIWFANEDITFLIENFITSERKKPGRGKSYSFVNVVNPSKPETAANPQADKSGGGDTNGTARTVEVVTRPEVRPVKQPRGKHLKILTSGMCDFRFGITQEVLVNVIDLKTYIERQRQKSKSQNSP